MPAAQGNQYAQGNTGGRPPHYTEPAELHLKCEEYFAVCVEGEQRPTTAGLALFLGFSDKQSLYDYRKREEFSYPIKRALLKIECSLEQMLHGANVKGAIFGLRNMGWYNRPQTSVPRNIQRDLLQSMTDEELNKLLFTLISHR